MEVLGGEWVVEWPSASPRKTVSTVFEKRSSTAPKSPRPAPFLMRRPASASQSPLLRTRPLGRCQVISILCFKLAVTNPPLEGATTAYTSETPCNSRLPASGSGPSPSLASSMDSRDLVGTTAAHCG
jgi:hypothetical protein